MSDTTPQEGATPQHAADTTPATGTYTPMFNDTVRTIIYIVTLVAGIVGLGVSAFGTTYNPMRLAGK